MYHPVGVWPGRQLSAYVTVFEEDVSGDPASWNGVPEPWTAPSPLPRLGVAISFCPQRIKISRDQKGVRVEVGMCPHMAILCASVFPWASLSPVRSRVATGPLSD